MFEKLIVVCTCTKFRKNFGNVWLFFKVIIPTMFGKNMFPTTTFISIRFTFTICYGANKQFIMWQQFQPFWLFGSPNTIFPWSFASSYLIYQIKRFMFQNKCLFWTWNKTMLTYFTGNAMGTFLSLSDYHRAFRHNRVCKLQADRFPVFLLITCIACIFRN